MPGERRYSYDNIGAIGGAYSGAYDAYGVVSECVGAVDCGAGAEVALRGGVGLGCGGGVARGCARNSRAARRYAGGVWYYWEHAGVLGCLGVAGVWDECGLLGEGARGYVAGCVARRGDTNPGASVAAGDTAGPTVAGGNIGVQRGGDLAGVDI